MTFRGYLNRHHRRGGWAARGRRWRRQLYWPVESVEKHDGGPYGSPRVWLVTLRGPRGAIRVAQVWRVSGETERRTGCRWRVS